MKRKLPPSFFNSISLTGVLIALVSFFAIVILFFANIFLAPDNPYIGIVTYLVFPVFLIGGLLLIPLGMLIERNRQLKKKEVKERRLPVIDFNQHEQRNAFLLFLIVSIVFIILSSIGGYKAYNFTESVAFCGKICHTIMKPEYTTYLNSPHARVSCVECHVGEGANWYVKSKLSGAYQVYATLANKYPKPIPTPIENLRPAQETCEHCHWPRQFFGGKQRVFTYYLSDEENTPFELNMLMKVGGGSPETSKTSGIHWHMNIQNKIEFISTDEKRENIPWVRSTNLSTGEVKTFVNEDNPPSEELLAESEIHTMDCMDCHNRPTHIFKSPSVSVNKAISINRIDKSLPMVKSVSVELLANDYETTESAVSTIAEEIWKYYRENYQDIFENKKDSIKQAIKELQSIYKRNIFPEMGVKWEVYHDNIGHLNFPGCYRCHDNKHITEFGDKLANDCNQCHTIMSQTLADEKKETFGADGLEFQHPVDIGDDWKLVGCFECHTGLNP